MRTHNTPFIWIPMAAGDSEATKRLDSTFGVVVSGSWIPSSWWVVLQGTRCLRVRFHKKLRIHSTAMFGRAHVRVFLLKEKPRVGFFGTSRPHCPKFKALKRVRGQPSCSPAGHHWTALLSDFRVPGFMRNSRKTTASKPLGVQVPKWNVSTQSHVTETLHTPYLGTLNPI